MEGMLQDHTGGLHDPAAMEHGVIVIIHHAVAVPIPGAQAAGSLAALPGAHQLGHAQGGAELGKFGGLDAERPNLDPRHGTLDVPGQHGRDKEQHQETYIYNVGKRLNPAVVSGQDDGAQHQRGGNPDNLHAGACAEVEEVSGLVKIVAGTADAEPSACY